MSLLKALDTPPLPETAAELAPLVGGLSLPLGRAVSLASTCVIFALLYRALRSEGCPPRYALFGPLIYAALFRTCGAFYDLARPDSLALALTLSTILLIRSGRTWIAVIAASILCSVAFLTKQTSAVFFPPLALALAVRAPGRALVFTGLTLGLSAGAVFALDAETEGAFWSYIFEGHQGHTFYWKNILLKYWRDLLFLAPLVLLLPLLWFSQLSWVGRIPLILGSWWAYAFTQRALTLNYRPHMYYRELFYESPRWLILLPPLLIGGLLLAARGQGRLLPRQLKTSGFWLWIYIAGAGASALNHSTQWAYSNCFMPLTLCVSLFIPQALYDLCARGTSSRDIMRRRLIFGALSLQLIALAYSPAAQIPSPESWEAYHEVEARIEAMSEPEQPLLSPAHPLYGWTLRGRVFTHQMGLQDVSYRGGLPDLRPRLRRREWGAILLETRNQIPGLEEHYFKAWR